MATVWNIQARGGRFNGPDNPPKVHGTFDKYNTWCGTRTAGTLVDNKTHPIDCKKCLKWEENR